MITLRLLRRLLSLVLLRRSLDRDLVLECFLDRDRDLDLDFDLEDDFFWWWVWPRKRAKRPEIEENQRIIEGPRNVNFDGAFKACLNCFQVVVHFAGRVGEKRVWV